MFWHQLKAEHRVHYRLILGELGKPITQFGSLRQVLHIMHDALEGKVPRVDFELFALADTKLNATQGIKGRTNAQTTSTVM